MMLLSHFQSVHVIIIDPVGDGNIFLNTILQNLFFYFEGSVVLNGTAIRNCLPFEYVFEMWCVCFLYQNVWYNNHP